MPLVYQIKEVRLFSSPDHPHVVTFLPENGPAVMQCQREYEVRLMDQAEGTGCVWR
jgi:hypothetical protein